MRGLFVVPVVVAFIFIGGCATTEQASQWESVYQMTPAGKALAAERHAVAEPEIREVTPEQWVQANERVAAYFDARNLAPEDATDSDREAASSLAFDSFRIRADPGEYVCIGSSSSWLASGRMDPELAECAKRVGADMVVVASQYLGTEQRTTVLPFSSPSYANVWGSAYGSGGWATGSAQGYGVSTQYVPVSYNQRVYDSQALFFRRTRQP